MYQATYQIELGRALAKAHKNLKAQGLKGKAISFTALSRGLFTYWQREEKAEAYLEFRKERKR